VAATPGRSPSLKNVKVYDALCRKGYSETKAAKISNAQKQLHNRARVTVHKAARGAKNLGSRKGAHSRKS
jgi:hypothetical protein